jgi:hypothetical protein
VILSKKTLRRASQGGKRIPLPISSSLPWSLLVKYPCSLVLAHLVDACVVGLRLFFIVGNGNS